MRMLKSNLMAVGFLFTGATQAATAVFDNFDTGLNGWGVNTTQTNVSNPLSGGNPNGYLSTDNLGNPTFFGVVGSSNTGADYSGVFVDGSWNISVDLNFLRGDFTDAMLRFRFQDSTANGWHYSLTDTFNNGWTSYNVTFDTTWSDADAILNGWVKEPDGTLTNTPSFSALWDNVYTSEVRLIGNPDINLLAGIDNYRASVVPIPAAVWLFISGFAGLMAISRKRK